MIIRPHLLVLWVAAVASCSSTPPGQPIPAELDALVDEVVAFNQGALDEARYAGLAWSHDGAALYALLAGAAEERVLRIDVESGATRPIDVGSGPVSVALSPTDDELALVVGTALRLVRGDGTELRRLELPAPVAALAYSTTGLLALATDDDVYVVEARELSLRRSSPGGRITSVAWAGTALLLSLTNDDETSATLQRCPERGECVRLTDKIGAEGALAMEASPDGQEVFFFWDRSQSVFQTGEPALVGADGTNERRLQPAFPVFVASRAWWTADGAAIQFGCQSTALQRHVCTVSRDGTLERFELGALAENDGFVPDRARGRIAYVARTALGALQVRVVGANGRGDRLVVELQPEMLLGGQKTFEVEALTWSSTDGLEMNGLLFSPSGAAPKGLIVDLHGGPMSGIFLDGPGVTAGSPVEWQLWTKLGYAVLVPNDRRSNLHGIGPLQAMVDAGDWTSAPVADVLTGIDAVVRAGKAPERPVGLLGHSAGSVLAYQLHARHSDRFAFVFSKGGHAGDRQIFRLAGLEPPCPRAELFEFRGLSASECERRLDVNSALPFVDRATAPLFVASGGEDEARWPADYVEALEARGRVVEQRTYADELHTIERPENQRDLLGRVTRYALEKLR